MIVRCTSFHNLTFLKLGCFTVDGILQTLLARQWWRYTCHCQYMSQFGVREKLQPLSVSVNKPFKDL